MATDTKLDSLVINYLTQSQYNTAKTNGKLNANQIYMTPASTGIAVETWEPTITAASGWEIGLNKFYKIGKMIYFEINVGVTSNKSLIQGMTYECCTLTKPTADTIQSFAGKRYDTMIGNASSDEDCHVASLAIWEKQSNGIDYKCNLCCTKKFTLEPPDEGVFYNFNWIQLSGWIFLS